MQLWPGRAQSFPRYMRQGPAPLSCARHGGRGEPRPPDPRSIAKPARLGAGPLEIALDHRDGHRQLAAVIPCTKQTTRRFPHYAMLVCLVPLEEKAHSPRNGSGL